MPVLRLVLCLLYDKPKSNFRKGIIWYGFNTIFSTNREFLITESRRIGQKTCPVCRIIPQKCPKVLNDLKDVKGFIVCCRRRQSLHYILIFPIKMIYLCPRLNWGIVPINLKLIVFNRNGNETLCHTATYDAACRYRTRFRPLSRLGCRCQRRPVVRGWRFLRCITNYKP